MPYLAARASGAVGQDAARPGHHRPGRRARGRRLADDRGGPARGGRPGGKQRPSSSSRHVTITHPGRRLATAGPSWEPVARGRGRRRPTRRGRAARHRPRRSPGRSAVRPDPWAAGAVRAVADRRGPPGLRRGPPGLGAQGGLIDAPPWLASPAAVTGGSRSGEAGPTSRAPRSSAPSSPTRGRGTAAAGPHRPGGPRADLPGRAREPAEQRAPAAGAARRCRRTRCSCRGRCSACCGCPSAT